MGDRGNIVMRYDSDKSKDIYFYTHWYGSDIRDVVRRALAHRQRWDDDAYLARIVFQELLGLASDKFTGFGISPRMQDNEHNLLVIDVKDQAVIEQTEQCVTLNKWSFHKFIALKEASSDTE